MITKPKLEDRTEQRYVGIRTQAPMRTFKTAIPQLLGEVFAWVEKQGVEPADAPFIRYHQRTQKIETMMPMCGQSGNRLTVVRLSAKVLLLCK